MALPSFVFENNPFLAGLRDNVVWLSLDDVMAIACLPEGTLMKVAAHDLTFLNGPDSPMLIQLAALSDLFWSSDDPDQASRFLRYLTGHIAPRLFEAAFTRTVAVNPWDIPGQATSEGRYLVSMTEDGTGTMKRIAPDACVISRSNATSVSTFLREFLAPDLLDDALQILRQRKDALRKSA